MLVFRAQSAGLVYASERVSVTVNAKLFSLLLSGLAFHGMVYYYAATAFLLAIWGWLTIKRTDSLSLTQVEKSVFRDG